MGCLDENAIAALLDRRLGADERAAIEQHLDACEPCRMLVALAQQDATRAPEAGAELGPGAIIGRYRVLRRLGAGAMGIVYAAEHLELRRKVALKIVRAGVGRDGDRRQLCVRLLREARAASAIRHPNVVTVHDVLALDDGSPVMVMDLLEGETLRAKLDREGALGVAETAAIVVQVLSALEAAHGLGVVHRDLKPDNVFLVREAGDTQVRLVDFGIAKLTSIDGPAAQTAGLTEAGMLVGTPHYMAPEQAFGEGSLDARADLWSAGVILFECLSGRLPLEQRSIGAILKALARLPLPSLGTVAPHVPAELAALVDGLLVEREARAGSAADVRRRLEPWRDAAASSIVVRGPSSSSPSHAGDTAGGVTIAARQSWLAQVRPLPMAGGIGVLVVAAAAIAATLVEPSVETAAPAPALASEEPETPVATSLRRAPPVPTTPVPSASAAKPRPQRAAAVATALPSASSAAPAASEGPGKIISRPPF